MDALDNRSRPSSRSTDVRDQTIPDRRREIIAVSARMFQERGYAGTTVRDIAREVGITSGSIFHHFGSKEEVLLQVVEEGLRHATTRIEAEGLAMCGPRQRLAGMVRAHLSALHDESPEAMSVLFHGRWTLSPETMGRMVAMRDRYESLWDAVLAEFEPFAGGDRRKRVRLLLFGAMNWSAQWYRPGGEFDLDAIAGALVETYLGPA